MSLKKCVYTVVSIFFRYWSLRVNYVYIFRAKDRGLVCEFSLLAVQGLSVITSSRR